MFKSRKRYINFLIIPEGSSRNINFKLSFWKTWIILGLFAFLIVILILSVVLYGQLLSGVISTKSLRQENKKFQEYNARVAQLEKELQEYRRFTKRVAELAGVEYPFPSDLKTQTSGLRLYGEGTVSPPKSDTGPLLSQASIYSSPKDIEVISKLPERSGYPQSSSERFTRLDKVQVESDSLRHIPKGQPIDGWISKGFSKSGYVFGGEHSGIDFAAKEGTEVRATADGTVSFAGWDDSYGNLVVVDHKNGYLTYYGHNSKILVNSGNSVKRGQLVAFSGNSGRSSAPHLHYEIRKVEKSTPGGDSIPIDPKDFLNLK